MAHVGDLMLERYESCVANDSLPTDERAALEIRLSRLKDCREAGRRRKDNPLGRVWGYRCQLPLCYFCASFRAKRDHRKVMAVAERANPRHLRLVTLTITAEHVDPGIEALRAAAPRLRRSSAFRGVLGGWFFREVSGHADYIGVRPHIHGIVESPSPLNRSALEDAWEKATEFANSSVDIQLARSVEKATAYCTKRRLTDRLALDDLRFLEISVSDIGARRGSMFGSWRGGNS